MPNLTPAQLEHLEAVASTLRKNSSIDIGRLTIFGHKIGRAYSFDEHGTRYPYKRLFWNVYLRPRVPKL